MLPFRRWQQFLERSDIPNWRLMGDWWDLCNCAIGCPCNFGSDPTLGYCEGVLTWLIRDGNYGDLKISKDLAVVLIIHWEGNVFEKNREFGFLIDDRANAAEREALAENLHRLCRRRVCRLARPDAARRRRRIREDERPHDAEDWRVEVPGMIEGLGGPSRKYMVPEATPAASTTPRARRSCPASSPSAPPSATSSPALRPQMGLVEPLVQAHRLRSARAQGLHLAQSAATQ